MKKKHDFTDKELLVRIEGWARDGWEDKQIAEQLGYSAQWFCELKTNCIELAESLKRGRAPLDIVVETSLYKRAVGMKRLVQQPFFSRQKIYFTKHDKSGERVRIYFRMLYIFNKFLRWHYSGL